ncbi:hypothetical protein [Desulfobulbus propionicus]
MPPDLKIIWNLIFKIFPIPNNNEVIDQVTFVKNSPVINALAEVPASKYQISSSNYLLAPPVHETIEKIKRLILLKAIHNCIYERIEIELIKYELYNEIELKEKKLKYKFKVSNALEQYYNIYEEDDRFDEAISYWKSGFRGKTSELQEDIIEIAKWVVMAQEEKSEMKSFIMLYLAFNSLYSMFSNYVKKTKKSQAKTEIKNVFYNLLTENRLNEVLRLNSNGITGLTRLNILSSDGKENFSLALAGVMRNNCETKHILYQAALCVHQVRNELFHYGIGMKNRNSKILISKFFLNTLIPRCLRDFIDYK